MAGTLGLVVACSTLADNGGGDVALPNAAAGPFRMTETGELGEGRVAPYALRDDERFFRAPCVLDEDRSATTPATLIFAAMNRPTEDEEPMAQKPPDALVRFRAADGRSPDRQFEVVLTAEATWEDGHVGAPSAVWRDDEIFLYYAGANGVGLAVGDGLAFTRVGDDGHIIGPGATPGGDVPRDPGVLRAADGTFHLFYATDLDQSSVIVEATSRDGLAFEDHRVVLRPRSNGDKLDAPHPVSAVSGRGRDLLYLYLATTTGEGRRRIDVAARFGPGRDEPLQWAEGSVYDPGSDAPTDPFVLRTAGMSLIFVTQASGTGSDFPAVAVGVAPADVSLLP